jgi:enoyl-CoA hydratase/carnithine racemase
VSIRWERDAHVGVAVVDRPERRNALNAEVCEELLGHLASNADLRAVVITGAGDQAFSAGADLARRTSDVGGLEPGGRDTFRSAFDALLASIVGYPAPVIAAVNGAALGAGMQLAVACDLRVVARHATFGIPSARLGILLSAASIGRLAALVGQAMARDLLFTARTLDIEEAERVGLVQRRADDALGGARLLAEELSARLLSLSSGTSGRSTSSRRRRRSRRPCGPRLRSSKRPPSRVPTCKKASPPLLRSVGRASRAHKLVRRRQLRLRGTGTASPRTSQ